MKRPKVIDAFMFNNELDILECRLVEIADAVDHIILCESERDHQDHRKPLVFAENRERFAPWKDKLIHVIVCDGEMPSHADDQDPWAREHAQREFFARGLAEIDGLSADDVFLQSDVDEIPRALHARNIKPGGGTVVLGMRAHFFAVDWHYEPNWMGTTATTLRNLDRLSTVVRGPFAYMRDQRLTTICPPGFEDAGWHLSWLGGADAAVRKVRSFCHGEVEQQILHGLATDRFLKHGYHVDGTKMKPVDVDETWPRWIVEGNAPESWYRIR